jgi:pyroglutamyl-peptidase
MAPSWQARFIGCWPDPAPETLVRGKRATYRWRRDSGKTGWSQPMRSVLLTGFEAFGTTPVNPAEQVARHLDGEEVGGAKIVARIIPNTFFTCIEVVQAAIAELRPVVVVMMGEYGGRAMITVERIAQNLNDGARYGLRDNDGKLLQDVLTAPDGPAAYRATLPLRAMVRAMRDAGIPLQDVLTAPDGPAAYRATLPVRAMVRAMRDAGIPSDISDTAGTFCCNHLMYGILHHIAVEGLDLPAGWVHLPHLPEVAVIEQNLGAPSMSVETAAVGLRTGIAAIAAHPEDTTDLIASRLQI